MLALTAEVAMKFILLFFLGVILFSCSAIESSLNAYSIEEANSLQTDFSKTEISIYGVLLWHGDEPDLFLNMKKLNVFDNNPSIRLQFKWGADHSNLDRKCIVVTGIYNPKIGGPGKGYFFVNNVSESGLCSET